MKTLEEIRKEVEKIKDKNGTPVEEHIKELVIGLWACGIRKTEKSCEGHTNYGRGYPWVDISYDEADKLLRVVRWQNRLVLPAGQPNSNTWVVKPRSSLELMPENRDLSLKKLQENATEFGLFLQGLSDNWFHEDCFKDRFKNQT